MGAWNLNTVLFVSVIGHPNHPHQLKIWRWMPIGKGIPSNINTTFQVRWTEMRCRTAHLGFPDYRWWRWRRWTFEKRRLQDFLWLDMGNCLPPSMPTPPIPSKKKKTEPFLNGWTYSLRLEKWKHRKQNTKTLFAIGGNWNRFSDHRLCRVIADESCQFDVFLFQPKQVCQVRE